MAYGNTDEGYQEICNFLDMLSTKYPNMLWDSGWMNCWRHTLHTERKPQDQFFRDNAHIWRSSKGEIVGLCISEYGKNDLFMEVLPGYEEIFPKIFRWIKDNWAVTRDEVEIAIYGEDRRKISWLKEYGFTFQRHSENKRTYDLDNIDLRYELEPGYSIQAFSESYDYDGRIALVQSAFGIPNYPETKLRGLMASPDYIDEYNLMVVSPDKQPVAYCVGWPERSNKNKGYIEPVGTHAEYRQRGFAKAVIRECFTRMKTNGIQFVVIASAPEPAVGNFLYDSLSPKIRREVHKYSKKVL